MPDSRAREKYIMELQRDLLNACMEYQIENGAGTIVFNVSINFVRGVKQ